MCVRLPDAKDSLVEMAKYVTGVSKDLDRYLINERKKSFRLE